MKPCLTCGAPTRASYCPTHARDRTLPTRVLPRLLAESSICVLCGQPVTEPRGRTSGAPSVEHLDGNPANDLPSNLALAHLGCNARDAGVREPIVRASVRPQPDEEGPAGSREGGGLERQATAPQPRRPAFLFIRALLEC